MENKRAIYCECLDPIWIPVSLRLQREYGVDPCIWTGPPEAEPEVRNRFPGIVFQSRYDAGRAFTPAPFDEKRLRPLDDALLERLASYETQIYKMMDRMDPFRRFSLDERVRLYHRYLRIWATLIESRRPEIFITMETPHNPYCFVAYLLCRDSGIQTVMSANLPFEDMLVMMEDYRKGLARLAEVYREKLNGGPGDSPGLSPRMADYLKTLRGVYDQAMPDFMKIQQRNRNRWVILRYLDRIRRKIDEGGKLLALLRTKFRNQLRKRKEIYPFMIKLEEGSIETASLTVSRHERIRSLGRRYKKELKRSYSRLAAPPDYNAPYIFVALHYQPEMSTAPLGGRFVYQYLMVDLLSKSVPLDWEIYVKEHKVQFFEHFYGERSRTGEFYEDLARLPNVKLVALDESPFKLLDHARAVATVTGTIGFEALARGKPALVFGFPWYLTCHGVFHVRDHDSCQQAVASIQNGFQVESEKVDLFLESLEECGRFGSLRELKVADPADYERMIINAARAIGEVAVRNGKAGRVERGA